MKATYGAILVLVMATAVLLSTPLPCGAVEKEEKSIWHEGESKHRHKWWKLTDEKIERMMNRLKEADPEKAKELEKLREESEEKFKAELRKVVRERYKKHTGRRFRSWGEPNKPFMKPCRPGMGPRMGHHGMPGMKGRRGMRMGMNMQEKHAEYLKWLKENYPEKAEGIAELREENPELYMRKLWHGYKKYRRIAEAEKENPKLAQALKEDLELKNRRDKLLRKIRAASDDEKRELVKELEGVASSRFDLIVKRKQIEYEQLLKKLEKLKERVKQSEAEVEKWKDVKFKNENVKARVEELVSGTEKFKWN